MLSISIFAVGKLKESFWKDACAEYLKRLGAYAKVSVKELPDSNKEREAQLILQSIPEHTPILLLDIKGKEVSSEQLATKIDGLIEDTKIEWNSEDKVVVSFDEHTVNNIVVNLKKPMSAPIKIFDGDNLIYQQNNNSAQYLYVLLLFC